MKFINKIYIYNQNNLYKSYLIGFLFSIILTLIPFFLISYKLIYKKILIKILIICTILQIFVHLLYFLKINIIFKKKWYLIAFIFSFIIIFILIVGSLWIMYHLNHNIINY